LPSFAPREDVLIPARQARKMRRARDLLDEAQRRARDIVAEAGEQAQQVRRQAAAAGYEDGVLAAAAQVAAHVGAAQRLAQRLSGRLEQYAGDMLGATLERPETVAAMLEAWLAEHAGAPDLNVRIWLPETARGMRTRLAAALGKNGQAAASIAYHDDPRLVILCGEQVLEFDPPELNRQLRKNLLRQFDDLPNDCRVLSEAALARWRDMFEQRFAAGNGDNHPDPRTMRNAP